ncbi:MAG TPA: hypothetical protein VGE54_05345 [Brevundimonas sp.]
METDVHPDGRLAAALVACGVDPVQVKIEWDGLCQEDVLTFLDASLAGATLSALADLYLTFPSRFVFATDALQEAFEAAVTATPAMVRSREALAKGQKQKLEDAGLSSFSAFDPAHETLQDFAMRVETACGFGPGELLKVRAGETISIEPQNPAELRWDKLGLVIALLEQSGLGVPVIVTGTAGPVPKEKQT